MKTNGSDLTSAESNTVGCVNNLLHSMLSYLSVSLKGRPVSLHERNYHYKAYLEEILNYGSAGSGTHLVSSFWFFDLPTSDGALKDKNGYTTRLNYHGNSKTLEL